MKSESCINVCIYSYQLSIERVPKWAWLQVAVMSWDVVSTF